MGITWPFFYFDGGRVSSLCGVVVFVCVSERLDHRSPMRLRRAYLEHSPINGQVCSRTEEVAHSAYGQRRSTISLHWTHTSHMLLLWAWTSSQIGALLWCKAKGGGGGGAECEDTRNKRTTNFYRAVHPLKGHLWDTGQKRCPARARRANAPATFQPITSDCQDIPLVQWSSERHKTVDVSPWVRFSPHPTECHAEEVLRRVVSDLRMVAQPHH